MISEKSAQTLELHKIMERVAAHTSFGAGAEIAREWLPTTDLDEARIWQRETAEARELLEQNSSISMGGARDVREVVLNAQRGVIIEPNVLLDIRYTLRRGTTLKRMLGHMKGHFPLLAEIASEVEECNDLQEAIARSIDDNAEVMDTASPRLAIIRRDLKQAFERLQSKLNRIVQSKANAPLLQEHIVTMRNGRYVVPLKAEHKGKIKGIVHDSSSSGATLFIEPLDTVELNNKWRELQLDEEKEILRILRELTEAIGGQAENIARTVEVLGYLDFTFARARYAEELNAVQPELLGFTPRPNGHPGSTIDLKGARHPLLKGRIVPIDVEFGDDTWALVVTGPNTGGKTVSLKTVGLLTLMAQSGLQLPADSARLSVFEGIFADIGDEQSIEQSLSTFSAHMTNIISILRECNNRSLVILDELGAGTDPAEGSALARAILTYLVQRGVTCMVSTHHPELKVYSVETHGVRNASVEFDLETLAPTYRLIIGVPGRSNALQIARRLGLPEDIINAAREMVATEDLAADDLLDEIQRTRVEIREAHEEIEQLREELAAKREELTARLDKIEDERRDILAAARRNAEGELDEFRKELKRLRREMQSAKMPLETVHALQAAVDKLSEWTQEPLDDDAIDMPEDIDWIPKLGDTVWLETLNSEGVITELDDKEAQVQVGNLRVRAKYRDMRKRTRSEKRATERERGRKRSYAPSSDPRPKAESPGLELDLRGDRVETALEKLDRYVDAAYTAGLPFGRIIHGKGTGRLRTAVRDYLSSHPLIAKIEEGRPNEGGNGVTIIHLASIT